MKRVIQGMLSTLACSLLISVTANAAAINCGVAKKSVSFGDADSCLYSNSNPGIPSTETLGSLDHSDYLGGINSSSNALGSVFSLSFTQGNWGSQNASGNWSFLSPSFWNTHDNVWVGFHVGGPAKDGANTFLFKVTEDTLSGTWSFINTTGKGGFSAVHLWANEVPYSPEPPPPAKVPESSSYILMILGLLALGIKRRTRA